jgi:sulfur carrier protein
LNVTINGAADDVPEDATVRWLVARAGAHARQGVAVALNDEVVPKGEWDAVTLTAGDRIEILRAIGGG